MSYPQSKQYAKVQQETSDFLAARNVNKHSIWLSEALGPLAANVTLDEFRYACALVRNPYPSLPLHPD